jgi:hypothetical protein
MDAPSVVGLVHNQAVARSGIYQYDIPKPGWLVRYTGRRLKKSGSTAMDGRTETIFVKEYLIIVCRETSNSFLRRRRVNIESLTDAWF